MGQSTPNNIPEYHKQNGLQHDSTYMLEARPNRKNGTTRLKITDPLDASTLRQLVLVRVKSKPLIIN